VRELVENAIGLVRERERGNVEQEAQKRVQERLLDLLLPRPVRYARKTSKRMPNATNGAARKCAACSCQGRLTNARWS